MKRLENLGFDDWFQKQTDDKQLANHEVARVVSVHKESYVVTKGQGEVFAELTGNLLYAANSTLDLPTTGDWVYADFFDQESHGIIHGVLPRKRILKRKTAGKMVEFQLIGANIDVAFIIQSVDYNFNLRRLERYLVMVNESAIKPVILLSKSDLVSPEQLEETIKTILAAAPQAQIQAFSNLTGDNISTLKNSLLSGQTYCLIGSSGVGKTTLLNSLVGTQQFETQSVSKKENKGRHTTTSRELIQLENGALLMDTPGMRELGNLAIDSGLEETFSEISELAGLCKFHNCSHTNEKGCAILAATEAGTLDEGRYSNYTKMKKESEFYELSYREKRKKDKDFGKMIKTTLKHKPNKR